MQTTKYTTNSEEETFELGKEFSKRLTAGDVVLFYGDLGSGKTEFIKGICKQLQVDDIVTSPTFTIMNRYDGNVDGEELPVYHIDLYRIEDKKELNEIGFEECVFESNSIKLIEWAERADNIVPRSSYQIQIDPDEEDENKREITITEEARVYS